MQLTRGEGARRAAGLVEQALQAWDIRDPDAITLIVATELIENVHQHTGDTGELRLELRDGEILVLVSDASSALPQVQDYRDPGRVSGRGLQLVQLLARSWGARVQPTGKVVWAELALAAPARNGWGDSRRVEAPGAAATANPPDHEPG